jgi:hypothetical protein
MKKLFFLVILINIINDFQAQNVGINIPNPQTALEVRGRLRMTPNGVAVTSNTTFLPANEGYVSYNGTPGVDFTLATPSGIKGSFLMIENTTPNLMTITGVTTVPSNSLVLLFYDDIGWKVLNDQHNTWSLTGNSGTSSSANFIGTTDSQPLNFKVNSNKAGKIDLFGNTAFGFKSLNNFSPASIENTGLGQYSLFSLENGEHNVGIGAYSMLDLKNGSRNIAIGRSALEKGLSNEKTVAIGYEALYYNDGKTENTAIGTYALRSNGLNTNVLSQGIQNTAVGSGALTDNRRGSGAVVIGSNAATKDTIANGIIAIGRNALHHNQNGRNNFAIGDSALVKTGFGMSTISQAGNNMGIGKNSLLNNVNGSQNIAIGLNALKNSINTDYNTGIGINALQGLLSGTKNTAVISWHNLSTGSFNVGLGRLSLAIPKANKNTMIGEADIYVQALTDSISENVLVGYRTGLSITGHKNVLLGNNAGGIYVNGRSNTAIGDSSIVKNESGNNNVSLGAKSGAALISGSGNVFIGYQAGAPEISSNKLYIENTNANKNNSLIYGDFAADSLLLNGKTVIRDNAVVRGYTKLGGYEASVPSIKMKKIIDTGPALNDSKSIVHGLNAAKILQIEIFMEWEIEGFPASPMRVVPPNFTSVGGLNYQYELFGGSIIVYNINGTEIAGKNLRILITYEE